METFMIIISGVLYSVATYLMLSKTLLRIILGTALLSHATHLMLLAVSGLKKGAVPLIGAGAKYTDPLPQALMLTSIVITFALTAYILVLAYRTYLVSGTDDINKLKGSDHE